MNDLHIVDCFSMWRDILDGIMLPDFTYTVNEKSLRQSCCCVNGMYSKYAILFETIGEDISKMERHFSSTQEALVNCRACVWFFPPARTFYSLLVGFVSDQSCQKL